MSKKLVIVESPSKAKTINKYLGKDFIVEATIGHIRNLPKSKLGIDVDNKFEPQFVNIRGKGDVIKKIKNLASKSKKIFIATDPDREGEAIAQDIVDAISVKEGTEIYRVLFNEITKNGILRGMNEPRGIDTALVSSQRARRVMDRIIGYKLSPFLWRAAIEESSNNLSAGRVQSVALRLLCEREVAIRDFVVTEYWSISGNFDTAKKQSFKAKLFSIENRVVKVRPKPDMSEEDWKRFNEAHISINNEDEAKKYYSEILKEKEFHISNVTKKKTKRNPSPPFITSSLQAEASRVLRMRPRETMGLAQKLYEGVDLKKEGIVGLITYMRTDSTRLSNEIVGDARNFISENFGKNFIPSSPNLFDKKKGNVQDAHEAIRPTSLKYTPEFVRPYLDDKSFKLYQLIWKRFIASQMSQAELETTVVEITGGKFLFKAYGQAVLFAGFMQLYAEEKEIVIDRDDRSEATNEIIPVGLEKDQKLKLSKLEQHQHFTKPPSRFTESTLIKELEGSGIGRPSTYSSIVSTILDRKYVEIKERKLFTTPLGEKINGILLNNFPDIIEVNFTARMEGELDDIAEGSNNFVTVVNDFYKPFQADLDEMEKKIDKIICDKCGSEMVLRIGRFGKFLACSNYPECKNIKSLREFRDENSEPEYTGETCAKCGARTIFRNGRFGRFIGCERYPDCDYIKNITLGIGCPKCKTGDVVERKSKRGRIFYGCNRFPECDFVSWGKPVAQECPNGDSKYLEAKYTAKKGNFLQCPVCKEQVKLAEPEEVSADR